MVVAQSAEDWAGEDFRQNMKGVLVIGEGAIAPSEQCRGTLEQGTKPTVARIGPCDELVNHPVVDLIMQLRPYKG